MSFNPNQLLNNPANLLGRPGRGAARADADLPPTPPPPFDPGLYMDAYRRLGLLGIENVADLGCGAGNFVSVMLEKGMRPEMYIGIDSNFKQISTAKAAYPGWKFVYGDLSDDRVRAEYERYGAFLMLNLIDALEDDLDFLGRFPEGKPLIFSLPQSQREGSRRFFESGQEIRERYSSILNLKSVGRYRQPGSGLSWHLILASKW
jgi:SAM-dependent methyltransferase